MIRSSSLLEEVSAGHAPPLLDLTIDQLERMLATGILGEGEPVELIDGMLVCKDRAPRGGDPMAHGPAHATVVRRLQRLDRDVERLGLSLQAQLPVVLGRKSAPEPDIAVLRGPLDGSAGRHPVAADVLAVIEVADHSLAYDRRTKLELYASAAIPSYLIVNIPDARLELYEEPLAGEGRYARRTERGRGETLALVLGDAGAIELDVTRVLVT